MLRRADCACGDWAALSTSARIRRRSGMDCARSASYPQALMAAITEKSDWLVSTLILGGCWARAGSESRAQSASTIVRRVFREASCFDPDNRLVCGASVRAAWPGKQMRRKHSIRLLRLKRPRYLIAVANANYSAGSGGETQPPTLILENEITTRPLVGSPKLVAGRNWVKINAFFISGLSSEPAEEFKTR